MHMQIDMLQNIVFANADAEILDPQTAGIAAMAAMENMSVLERDKLVAKFTETKPGNRTLRITAKGI